MLFSFFDFVNLPGRRVLVVNNKQAVLDDISVYTKNEITPVPSRLKKPAIRSLEGRLVRVWFLQPEGGLTP
jgi:hypothetical protein